MVRESTKILLGALFRKLTAEELRIVDLEDAIAKEKQLRDRWHMAVDIQIESFISRFNGDVKSSAIPLESDFAEERCAAEPTTADSLRFVRYYFRSEWITGQGTWEVKRITQFHWFHDLANEKKLISSITKQLETAGINPYRIIGPFHIQDISKDPGLQK